MNSLEYEQGYDDFLGAWTLDENPYDPQSKWGIDWMAGWLFAREMYGESFHQKPVDNGE